MLKKILFAVAALLVLFLVFVATRPATFRIERSATIAAPPPVTFAFVNDFRYWQRWSPWEKLDPAMKKEHSGAPSGQGAVYYWLGNDQVGEGRMTITESLAPQKIGIKLEFIKPWTATNQATFSFTPQGEGTRVVWAMDGNNNFMGKLAGLFMDMDALVGKDFEAGLQNLAAVASAEAQRQREEKQLAAEKIKAAIEAAAAEGAEGGEVIPTAAPVEE